MEQSKLIDYDMLAVRFSLSHSHSHSLQIEEQREWKEGDKSETNGDERSSEGDAAVDNLIIYRQILEILKPGETVVKVSV